MRRLLASALPARRRGEEGVIAIAIALITCFTLIPLGAYAVDIGVQRVARRDAQAVADMVALDLSRQLDGRNYGQINPTLQALANKSAARNASGTGLASVTAQLGTINLANYDPSNPSAYFTAISNSAVVPNAVQVTVNQSVKFSLQPGTGGVARTAIGLAQGEECFSVGSYAANLDSAHSLLLNQLINDSLHLSVASYTGLASSNVSMLGLATQLGVGTVDGLLNLNAVSLGTLYLATANALQASGGSAANIALLNQLAAANIGTPTIKISDLFDFAPGSTAALNTSVNVLDIIAGSAMIANGTNALAVPSLTVGVPSLASSTTSLTVIQKPIFRCGRVGDSVQTSQVTLNETVNVSNLSILGLLTAQTTVTLSLQLAPATATLTNIFCGSVSGADVAVASALSQAISSVPIDLKLLGLTLVHIDGGISTSAPAATNTVSLRIPNDSVPVTKSTGSGVALSTLTTSNLNATVLGTLPLGMTLSGILSAVMSTIITPVVNPLISNLNTVLTGPLRDLLGLDLGGADVKFYTVPTCNNPTLAG
jgi:uncharacterized membrane protein